MRFDQKIKGVKKLKKYLLLLITKRFKSMNPQKTILDELQSATDNAFATIKKEKIK